MNKIELLNKVKECGQNAMNEGIYRQFRDELDTKLSQLGLTNKVSQKDLPAYVTCCVLALEEVREDKRIWDKVRKAQ